MSGENGEGFVDQLDDSDELFDGDVRILVDEEGNEMHCALLAVVEHEDHDYALLTPMEQLQGEDGTEIELYILEYEENEEGEEAFSAIDDDARYEQIKELFSTLIAEEQDEDEAEDEDKVDLDVN